MSVFWALPLSLAICIGTVVVAYLLHAHGYGHPVFGIVLNIAAICVGVFSIAFAASSAFGKYASESVTDYSGLYISFFVITAVGNLFAFPFMPREYEDDCVKDVFINVIICLAATIAFYLARKFADAGSVVPVLLLVVYVICLITRIVKASIHPKHREQRACSASKAQKRAR